MFVGFGLQRMAYYGFLVSLNVTSGRSKTFMLEQKEKNSTACVFAKDQTRPLFSSSLDSKFTACPLLPPPGKMT
jgi:hypothetical protein